MKSVHLTDRMLRGLILLAIKEQWSEEEVDKQIKNFAVATALNKGRVLDQDNVLTIAREVRAKKRRKELTVVDGGLSPHHYD